MPALHALPCHVDYSGEADVEQSFPYTINDEDSTASATFRGRKLFGKIHTVPNEMKVYGFSRKNNEVLMVKEFPSNSQIFEWTTDDVREPAKIDFSSIHSALDTQFKINDLILQK